MQDELSAGAPANSMKIAPEPRQRSCGPPQRTISEAWSDFWTVRPHEQQQVIASRSNRGRVVLSVGAIALVLTGLFGYGYFNDLSSPTTFPGYQGAVRIAFDRPCVDAQLISRFSRPQNGPATINYDVRLFETREFDSDGVCAPSGSNARKPLEPVNMLVAMFGDAKPNSFDGGNPSRDGCPHGIWGPPGSKCSVTLARDSGSPAVSRAARDEAFVVSVPVTPKDSQVVSQSWLMVRGSDAVLIEHATGYSFRFPSVGVQYQPPDGRGFWESDYGLDGVWYAPSDLGVQLLAWDLVPGERLDRSSREPISQSELAWAAENTFIDVWGSVDNEILNDRAQNRFFLLGVGFGLWGSFAISLLMLG